MSPKIGAKRQRRPALRTFDSRDEKKAATRRLLLEAAVDALCDLGYAGLTAAEISGRAGLSRGAIQHHFGNHADVVLAVFAEAGRALSEIDRSPPRGPLAARIGRAVDRYWEFFQSRSYVALVHLILGVRHEPDLQPRLARALQGLQPELDATWNALVGEPDVPPERIRSTRLLTLATLRGFALLRMFSDERAWSSEIQALKELLTSALSERIPSANPRKQRRSIAQK
jgi:AcrR family transcriptional regulator